MRAYHERGQIVLDRSVPDPASRSSWETIKRLTPLQAAVLVEQIRLAVPEASAYENEKRKTRAAELLAKREEIDRELANLEMGR